MPSQFFGLNIGASGLAAFQTALNTTANNVANVQTAGYSRQETTIKATAPMRVYAKYGSAGTGAEATEVKQQRDIYYDTKYWENNSSLGYFESKLYYLNQVEGVFADDVSQEGFSTIFAKMFNAMETLYGDNASAASVRNQFINRAQSLCTYFNALATELQSTQTDVNEEILNATENINAISKKIALLNKEINKLEIHGGYANELRDERALLLDELSTVVSVESQEYEVANTYGENLGGTNFRVMINGQILVDGNEYRTLTCVSEKQKNNQSDAKGLYKITWADTGMNFAATTGTAGGSLKALFDLRDGNNAENLSGKSFPLTKDANGEYKSITLRNLSNANVNSLNIPDEGKLEVDNKTFVYKSWEANVDADGNITDITFHLEEAIDPILVTSLGERTVEVGVCVNAMGIPYYQQQINEFLRTFTEMFNDIQKGGETLEGEPMGAFFTAQNPTGTEYNFDEWDNDPGKISSSSNSYYQLTAFNVAVNKESIKDPSYFSTTADITNGADAVDILDKLMTLQDEVEMYRGTNASGFLETLLSDISVDVDKTNTYNNNYKNMEAVIANQRTSVSGVDEDEEGVNLIKFQNAYNMNAKVISIMAEIYDKLINETGVT